MSVIKSIKQGSQSVIYRPSLIVIRLSSGGFWQIISQLCWYHRSRLDQHFTTVKMFHILHKAKKARALVSMDMFTMLVCKVFQQYYSVVIKVGFDINPLVFRRPMPESTMWLSLYEHEDPL